MAGTGIVRLGGVIQSDLLLAFLLFRSQSAFAFGQVFYKEIMTGVESEKAANLQVFACYIWEGFLLQV